MPGKDGLNGAPSTQPGPMGQMGPVGPAGFNGAPGKDGFPGKTGKVFPINVNLNKNNELISELLTFDRSPRQGRIKRTTWPRWYFN
jgi:hypothetical protein